jgi:hypothetical protein
MVKQEKVPEVRTESQRKSNGQLSKNRRLKELMLMLLPLQVDVVMEKDNLRQGQVKQYLKSLGRSSSMPSMIFSAVLGKTG